MKGINSGDPIEENGDKDHHRPTMIEVDSIVNDDNAKAPLNGLDSHVDEVEKEILLLRNDLNEANERLALTEDSYRIEQERVRSLTSDCHMLEEQLNRLKLRVHNEKNDNEDLVKEQQSELVHLSNSILSKQTEHDQLLSVYICFFLSCYLLIFFLFFFLLPW